MGTFQVEVTVGNPSSPERAGRISLLVDTGATLSWLPREFLEKIGIRPISRSRFILADGSRQERDKGIVVITVDGKTMGVPVAFAERGESSVLGATGLEILGFAVDPVERKLIARDLLAL